MSARFEHVDSSLVTLVPAGEELGDTVVDDYALVIGDPWDCAAVIEGTLNHLEGRLESMLRIVRHAQGRS